MGRGETAVRPLPRRICWLISIVGAKSSKWGDPAWPSPFPPLLRFSVIAVSLSFSFGPLSPSLLCSFVPSPFSPSHFLPSFSFIPCSKAPDLSFCLSFERIIQTSSDERGVMKFITCILLWLASHIRVIGNIFCMRNRSAILAPPNWISIPCWDAINVPRYIVKWRLRISVACWEFIV